MTQAHDIGDVRRLTANFTDINQAPADPTTVTFEIREPDGTITTKTGAQLTNPAVGTFYFDFAINQAGRHLFRYEGTGAIQAAGELEFEGLRQEVNP